MTNTVKDGKDLIRFRLVAKEGDNTAGEYEVKSAKFYDIIKDGNISANTLKSVSPAHIPSGMQVQVVQNVPSSISVAELLAKVKDRNGKPYVNQDGGLNYESEALRSNRYSANKTMTKEDADYFKAIRNGDIEEAQRLVNEKAAREGFADAIPEQTKAYVLRTGAAPKKAVKVYKVFTVAPDGSPTALFVAGTEKLPQGVWLDAADTWHFTGKNGHEYIPSTQNPYTKGGKTGGMQEIPNGVVS